MNGATFLTEPQCPSSQMAPRADLTRRTLFGGATAAAALLALAACTPSDTATGDATSRAVDIAGKRYDLPTDPKRVVSIDYFSGVFLTELGLPPVGGIDYSWVDDASMYPAYVSTLKHIGGIGKITATNIEKAAALKPDLVIGPTPGSQYDNSPGALKKLGSIAPAVAIDFGTTGDWRAPYAETAKAVNRTAKLQSLRSAYLSKITAAKQSHGSVIERTTIASLNYAQDGNFTLDLAPSSAGVVYSDLGLTFTSAARGTTSNGVSYSFEDLSKIADADVIFYRANADGSPGTGLPDVVALQAWKDLPAVKAGHAYPITWIDLCTYRWAELAVTDILHDLDRATGKG